MHVKRWFGMQMKPLDRVVVDQSFPPEKLRINNLVMGDSGTVVYVANQIALVRWDKGFRTTANVCDLKKEGS
jgi:hypothetical protein